jgi:NAD(P)-dependent dehydrogenase (short-subunit alcohol dehydrogenase family)
LGAEVLRLFLEEGARCVAVTHGASSAERVAAIAAQFPESCHAVQTDVTSPEGVANLRTACLEVFGPPQILANLVGGFAAGKQLWEWDVAEYQHMLALNLTSAFLCCRAFLPDMLAAKYGRIVNVASRAALIPRARQVPYAIAKAGVVALTQSLREELKGTGVAVCAVVPSMIDSPAARAENPQADPGKWIQPADLARVILYACTEDGGLLSGGLLPVYGGL